MRVLVLGGGGMLGHKLVEVWRDRFEVWTTLRGAFDDVEQTNIFDSRRTIERVDAENFDSIIQAFAAARPQVVVNCIGIVKQLKESNDTVRTLTINSIFPHRTANLCKTNDIRFITFSTDCVFSGKHGNRRETDQPDAIDLYGRSKHLGEVVGENCLTIRSSIIGRELKSAHSLVEWFLSNQNKTVNGFTRAIYTGLTTLEMARTVAEIIENKRDLSGMWHVASQPISKFELLGLVRDCFEMNIEIKPENEFYCDRSLNGKRFEAATNIVAPAWTSMIAAMANDSTVYRDWKRTQS